MVNRVAPWEKLVNGEPRFNMSTELAHHWPPEKMVERRGTVHADALWIQRFRTKAAVKSNATTGYIAPVAA